MPTVDYQFGSGVLFSKPVAGVLAANPTPLPFGTLQGVDLDMSFEQKELYGQFQFPVAIAKAKGKINLKAKFAQMQAKLINDLFFGQTINTGQNNVSYNEAHAIPSTPFQITIAPPGSGTFVEDLGVINAITGLSLTKVASTPTTGQYSVNEATGVYTFAAADTGNNVYVTYKYTMTSGYSFTISNQLMGNQPIFEVHLYQNFNGNPEVWKFNNCVATKLTRSTKLDDFTIPEFDFAAFADASGNLGVANLPQ